MRKLNITPHILFIKNPLMPLKLANQILQETVAEQLPLSLVYYAFYLSFFDSANLR
jgi:hypothetical protein